MSVRFSFRRPLFLIVCLLSLAAVGYIVMRKPFAAARIKDALTYSVNARGIAMEDLARYPEGVRVCEELIANPRWTERLTRQSQHVIINALYRRQSEALAPALRTFLEAWNRLPTADHPEVDADLAYTALQALLELDTASAKNALARLEQEFPPFPRPYAAALPAYLKNGKQREVLALAAAAIENARRISDRQARGWAGSRDALEDIRKGLDAIASLPEAKKLLWCIFAIQLADGDRLAALPSPQEDKLDEYADELFRHLPELPALNANQSAFLMHLPDIYWASPGLIAAAYERQLMPAEDDLRSRHWLKKLAVLRVLAIHGTAAELPRLEVFSKDQSKVRVIAKNRPNGLRDEIIQDEGAPIPPGWTVLGASTFAERAKRAHAEMRNAKPSPKIIVD